MVSLAIHDDISLIRFVIPGMTRNPVFFWIPAEVDPVHDTGAGMTAFAVINVAVYNSYKFTLWLLLIRFRSKVFKTAHPCWTGTFFSLFLIFPPLFLNPDQP